MLLKNLDQYLLTHSLKGTISALQGPYYGWLPTSRAVYDEYIKRLLDRVADRNSRGDAIQHVPAMESFRKAIEANPTMVELWRKVFLQVFKDNQVRAHLGG